jgi:hypothetical protein
MTFNMATVTIKFLTIHQAILTSIMISRVGSTTDRKYVNDMSVSTRCYQDDIKMLLHNLCTTLIHLHLKKRPIYIF